MVRVIKHSLNRKINLEISKLKVIQKLVNHLNILIPFSTFNMLVLCMHCTFYVLLVCIASYGSENKFVCCTVLIMLKSNAETVLHVKL